MKKTVYVKEFCCSRCTERLEERLQENENILRAKTDFKRNRVLLEVKENFSDGEIAELFEKEEIEILRIENRKSIFG